MNTKELNDWANKLDFISNKLPDKAFDLRDDEYGTKREGIIRSLKELNEKLNFVTEQLKKIKVSADIVSGIQRRLGQDSTNILAQKIMQAF